MPRSFSLDPQQLNWYLNIWMRRNPDSKVHVVHMGPTWVLSAPVGPHVFPMNLAIREVTTSSTITTICRITTGLDCVMVKRGCDISRTLSNPRRPLMYHLERWTNNCSQLTCHITIVHNGLRGGRLMCVTFSRLKEERSGPDTDVRSDHVRQAPLHKWRVKPEYKLGGWKIRHNNFKDKLVNNIFTHILPTHTTIKYDTVKQIILNIARHRWKRHTAVINSLLQRGLNSNHIWRSIWYVSHLAL